MLSLNQIQAALFYAKRKLPLIDATCLMQQTVLAPLQKAASFPRLSPTTCAHLETRLRLSWFSESIWNDLNSGDWQFHWAGLVIGAWKRGATFWLVSLRSDKLASACAALAVIKQAKCVLPGFYAIHVSGRTRYHNGTCANRKLG